MRNFCPLLLRLGLEQTCGGALDAAGGWLLCVSCFACCREIVLLHCPTVLEHPRQISGRKLLLPANSSPPGSSKVYASSNKMFTWPFWSICMTSAICPSCHKGSAFKFWGESWCGVLTPRACRAEVMTETGAWLCLHCFLMPLGRGTDDSL